MVAYGVWGFDAYLVDFNHSVIMTMTGVPNSVGGWVREYDLWGDHTTPLWTDYGSWRVTMIPEPSFGTFFWLGVIVMFLWVIKRHRAQNTN